MSKFEQPTTGSSQKEEQRKDAFQHQELIQFNDGEMALGFRTPGDKIEFGKHKYATGSSVDRIIVKTESGNTYMIGGGFIINEKEKDVRRLENLLKNLPDIVIGKSWEVPGFFVTSPIESVQLRYKSADQGYSGAEQVDKPNPFKKIDDYLEKLEDVDV